MNVIVVPYNPTWPHTFAEEAARLRDRLGVAVAAIHHIGSTAVPGLWAKPIIDILIETDDLALLDEREAVFETLAYEPMGEFGIPRRRYYRKGGDDRTHQIHAFPTGDVHVGRHLAFRDYLIAHPEVASAYAELKKDVAARCNHDIDIYGDGKHDFIRHHEALALAWVGRDDRQR